MLCLGLGQPTPSMLILLVLSMVATIFVFNNLNSASDAYWMLPMIGFAQLSLFAGYSIYFPELFPTRLRGTGDSFSYNTVRYLAAPPHSTCLLIHLTRISNRSEPNDLRLHSWNRCLDLNTREKRKKASRLE